MTSFLEKMLLAKSRRARGSSKTSILEKLLLSKSRRARGSKLNLFRGAATAPTPLLGIVPSPVVDGGAAARGKRERERGAPASRVLRSETTLERKLCCAILHSVRQPLRSSHSVRQLPLSHRAAAAHGHNPVILGRQNAGRFARSTVRRRGKKRETRQSTALAPRYRASAATAQPPRSTRAFTAQHSRLHRTATA